MVAPRLCVAIVVDDAELRRNDLAAFSSASGCTPVLRYHREVLDRARSEAATQGSQRSTAARWRSVHCNDDEQTDGLPGYVPTCHQVGLYWTLFYTYNYSAHTFTGMYRGIYRPRYYYAGPGIWSCMPIVGPDLGHIGAIYNSA